MVKAALLVPEQSRHCFDHLLIGVGLLQELAAIDKEFFKAVRQIEGAGVKDGSFGAKLPDRLADMDSSFPVVT